MDIQTPDKTEKIRHLNDLFRKTFVGGVIVSTRSVAGLAQVTQQKLMSEVQEFKDFTDDNDPHGEHDFGSIELGSDKFFWKIDYLDRSMEMGSPDPADPKVTKRVLTIMRADEY